MTHRPRGRAIAIRRAAVVATLLVLLVGSPAWMAAQDAKATKNGPAQPVDINAATAEQLTAIPGIGPTLAERIVEFRKKEGPFRRVEDLLKIRGIGERSLEKIRPHVKVGRSG